MTTAPEGNELPPPIAVPVPMTVAATPLADGLVELLIDDMRIVLERSEARRLAELIGWAAGDPFYRPRGRKEA